MLKTLVRSEFKDLGEIKRFNIYALIIARLTKKANNNLRLTKTEWLQLEQISQSLHAMAYNIPRDIHQNLTTKQAYGIIHYHTGMTCVVIFVRGRNGIRGNENQK